MRNMMSVLWVSFLLICSSPTMGEGNNQGKDSRLIRKMFLDVLGVPPTPPELDWYLVYNSNSYIKAVETVTDKYASPLKNLLYTVLISSSYKESGRVLLSNDEKEMIIKYQSGMKNFSLTEAENRLVELSIINRDNGEVVTEPLDFLATNLMARNTTLEEENFLSKIVKKYPSEKEGYLKALKIMETYEDFLYK